MGASSEDLRVTRPCLERPRLPSETSSVIAKPASIVIERAKRRDPDALAWFIQRHESRLRNYFAGPRHWHRALVPDLVQETFTRAIKSFPNFQGNTETQAEHWLYGIARNVHLQEISRQVGIRLRQDVAAELARLRQPHGHSWYMGDIIAALDSLPLAQLEVLRLLLEGLSTREIAAQLDVPEGTVASRVHRGRNALRERLGISLH